MEFGTSPTGPCGFRLALEGPTTGRWAVQEGPGVLSRFPQRVEGWSSRRGHLELRESLAIGGSCPIYPPLLPRLRDSALGPRSRAGPSRPLQARKRPRPSQRGGARPSSPLGSRARLGGARPAERSLLLHPAESGGRLGTWPSAVTLPPEPRTPPEDSCPARSGRPSPYPTGPPSPRSFPELCVQSSEGRAGA